MGFVKEVTKMKLSEKVVIYEKLLFEVLALLQQDKNEEAIKLIEREFIE